MGKVLGLFLAFSCLVFGENRPIQVGVTVRFELPGYAAFEREGLLRIGTQAGYGSLRYEGGLLPEEDLVYLEMLESDPNVGKEERRAAKKVRALLNSESAVLLGYPYRFETGTLERVRRFATEGKGDHRFVLKVNLEKQSISIETNPCVENFGRLKNP